MWRLSIYGDRGLDGVYGDASFAFHFPRPQWNRLISAAHQVYLGYCGNWPNMKASVAAGSDCNMTCTANSVQYCGGKDRLSLYTRSGEGNEYGPSTTSTISSSSSQSLTSIVSTSYVTIIATTSILPPSATITSSTSVSTYSSLPTVSSTSNPSTLRPWLSSSSAWSDYNSTLDFSSTGGRSTSITHGSGQTTPANTIPLTRYVNTPRNH